MSSIHRLPERVMVFTTPEELRKLADKMEQHIKNVKLGESMTVEIWTGDEVDIHFTFAQGK